MRKRLVNVYNLLFIDKINILIYNNKKIEAVLAVIREYKMGKLIEM